MINVKIEDIMTKEELEMIERYSNLYDVDVDTVISWIIRDGLNKVISELKQYDLMNEYLLEVEHGG